MLENVDQFFLSSRLLLSTTQSSSVYCQRGAKHLMSWRVIQTADDAVLSLAGNHRLFFRTGRHGQIKRSKWDNGSTLNTWIWITDDVEQLQVFNIAESDDLLSTINTAETFSWAHWRQERYTSQLQFQLWPLQQNRCMFHNSFMVKTGFTSMFFYF